ncbi:hypothetical protein ABIE50_000339 [Chitinophaga sp. OAE865]
MLKYGRVYHYVLQTFISFFNIPNNKDIIIKYYSRAIRCFRHNID